MKNKLVIVKGYGNILCRIENHVNDNCVYLRVLTGELKGGLINISRDSMLEIPDSENTYVQ